MSQPDPSARPSQVTVAGWAIAIASVLLVFAVFDTMGQLESLDMRDRLAEALRSGSGKDLGISVGDATEILRWCLYVSGVAAAASSILGVFALQGHRGARVGLTVSAVAIVLTASLAGSFPSFLGMFIGVGTALLWTRPARDWFAGRPVTVPERPAPRREEPAEPSPPVAWMPPSSDAAQPPPTPGWGQVPPPVPPPAPVPYATAWPAPPGQPVPLVLAPRPAQVRLACILTWVFSSVIALGYAGVLVLLIANKPWVAREMQKSPGWKDSFDVDTVTALATAASVVFVIWSLAAIVLAVLVWRRVRWAWILLLVSTCIAGLVSVLGFPFSLPYVAAIGATAGMLMRRPTRDWFAGPPYPGPPYPGPPMMPPPGQQPRPPVW